MEGWIKLHRKFLNWEWFSKTEMVKLFIYLLLKANHIDKKWQGILIKRGQLLTGRKIINKETGISEQSIRTCLKKLELTEEITIKSTNKYSIITICNYGNYQIKDSDNNQQLTNNQPTTNQQSTTTKNYKNYKNYKNILLSEIKISDLNKKNQTYYKIAFSFYELFKQNLLDAGASLTNLKKAKGTWVDDIRLIIESDKYSVDDLREIFDFLSKNEFWKKNILSISKLRGQFDKLKLQIKYQKNEKIRSNNQKGATIEEFAEMLKNKIDKRRK